MERRFPDDWVLYTFLLAFDTYHGRQNRTSRVPLFLLQGDTPIAYYMTHPFLSSLFQVL